MSILSTQVHIHSCQAQPESASCTCIFSLLHDLTEFVSLLTFILTGSSPGISVALILQMRYRAFAHSNVGQELVAAGALVPSTRLAVLCKLCFDLDPAACYKQHVTG